MPSPIDQQINRLIREDWGRLLSVLVAGCRDISLAEECLQEATLAALQNWPRSGVPDSPDAWLLTAARRKMIDQFRRSQTAQDKADQLALWVEQTQAEEAEPATLPDHRLELIFICCHPILDDKSRIALTLRALGGLTTEEIAAAFLDKPATMAARLTRAKKKVQSANLPFRAPEPEDLPQRVDGVLKVVYLIFNEGYRATSGPLTRSELASEAIRLGRILSGLMPDHTEIQGLLALMLLGESRRLARTENGHFVPLEEQNRARWDKAKISEGTALVQHALTKVSPGPYAIQAAISALHAQAADFAATDWRQIVALYELLLSRQGNPVIFLNQMVALSYAAGASHALEQLKASGAGEHLKEYQPFHSCRADLLSRTGQIDAARQAYGKAIEMAPSDEEKAFLTARLSALGVSEV